MQTRVILLLGLVALALLGLWMPLPQLNRGSSAAADLVHGPMFAVLAVALEWTSAAWRRHRHAQAGEPGSSIPRLFFIWLGLTLCGLGTEWVQQFFSRGSTWHDAIANSFGAAAGLLWIAGRRSKRANWIRRATPLAAAALLLAGAYGSLAVVFDVYRQRRALPEIASFEWGAELSRFSTWESQMARTRDHATAGQYALRIDLGPGVYPGVTMFAPPADWTGYDALACDVFVAGDSPLELTVKVHDLAHWANDRRETDRYQKEQTLPPGAQRIRIPLAEIAAAPQGRRMDLSRIVSLQFYVDGLRKPRTIYLDSIRLEKSTAVKK